MYWLVRKNGLLKQFHPKKSSFKAHIFKLYITSRLYFNIYLCHNQIGEINLKLYQYFPQVHVYIYWKCSYHQN